jgi:hypothetical protein
MSETDHDRGRGVGDGLRLVRRNLQVVHDGIVTAALALRHQNADRDREIAHVLEFLVGDRLADQIERTDGLLAALQGAESHSPPRDEEGGAYGDSHEVREPVPPWPHRAARRSRRSSRGAAESARAPSSSFRRPAAGALMS